MSDDILSRLRCSYEKDEWPCEQCTFCAARAEIEWLTDEIERLTEWRKNALLALDKREAEIGRLCDLLRDLTSSDDCRLDHHGYCQTHYWFVDGERCPHARAKEARRG